MIEIMNVSKRFRLWENRSRDLKETTINFLKGKRRSFREIWALRSINLTIGKGETVAFIGENGSGKSTLLRLLCGIYSPDEGKVTLHGKISALLELGVGFHPDLTGEENIFLNGAMLGFDRKEMERRFDRIVSFSEIEDFIYSPIRTYSSGMTMRLAFSIAICVNPDILLIDEVLSVGDEGFQRKCLSRFEEFRSAGKTIVIVSHALDFVRDFCDRIVLLHGGKVIAQGDPRRVIDRYYAILSNRERPADSRSGLQEKPPLLETHETGIREKEEKEPAEERTPLPEYGQFRNIEPEIKRLVSRHEEKNQITSPPGS